MFNQSQTKGSFPESVLAATKSTKVSMAQQTKRRTEEEIATLWGATLEQPYQNRDHTLCVPLENNVNSGMIVQDRQDATAPYIILAGDRPWELLTTPSQHDTNISMPTRNLSDLDGDENSASTDTVRRLPAHEKRDYWDAPLIDLGPVFPDTVYLEEDVKEKIEEEMETAVYGGSQSDKLTGDGSTRDGGIPRQPILFPAPPRPSTMMQSDRCITPQRSNVQRNLQSPASPGTRKCALEIYHHSYERDTRMPPSPVPPFVVVHSFGSARVTIRPTSRAVQSPPTVPEENPALNRSLYRRSYLFVLGSMLVLAVITMVAGIVRSKELNKDVPSVPGAPTNQALVTSLPTPAPSPTAKPVFEIPNEDDNLGGNFPDLGDGVIAREETQSPTSSDYVPPTRPPRTRRPSAPSPPPSETPSFAGFESNTSSLVPSEYLVNGASRPSSMPSDAPSLIPSEYSEELAADRNLRMYLYNLIALRSSVSNTSVVADVTSPQHSAFEWIVSDQMKADTMLSEDRILQRFAMATFYYATGGTNWTAATLWLSLTNECFWHSSRNSDICDTNGMLHSLQLENNQVAGELPPELELLPLRRIFLRGNAIGGTISSVLGKMVNLEFIQLTNNILDGPIPTEIGMLSNLLVLGLGRNGINATIPVEIGNLNRLDTLGLEGNNFRGPIPTQFGQMTKLRFVSMCSNDLTGEVPIEIGNLSLLEVFRVKGNNLSGSMPSQICSLRNTALAQLTADCDEVLCDDTCCTDCQASGGGC